MKKMLFVMNPYAGQRRANRYLADILSIFNRAGYRVESYMTGARGEATDLSLIHIGIGLPRLAKMAKDIDDFMDNLLPDACQTLGEFMNARVRFLVEKSNFFQTDFLVQEGLIERERFVGMYGVAGLCDCVNYLLRDKGLK